MVDMLVGGPGNGGHVGGKMNAGVEKPPDKFFRYSEADLQSGVSINTPLVPQIRSIQYGSYGNIILNNLILDYCTRRAPICLK